MASLFFAACGATVCPKTVELTASTKKAKSATEPIRRDPVEYEIDDTWFLLFIGGVSDYFEFLSLKVWIKCSYRYSNHNCSLARLSSAPVHVFINKQRQKSKLN
ncbi:MAG: hypothetical protein EBT98_01345 [Opitutaceae bacterium]|nr:hypothetical protein [Opitutaceae bacterium]